MPYTMPTIIRSALPTPAHARLTPILYFSTRLIHAGAWNAYLPVLLPGAAPVFSRGRAVRVAERNQVPVRYGPEVARLADRFPRAWGSEETVPARYRRGGVR